jgi:WD40 repeat protein
VPDTVTVLDRPEGRPRDFPSGLTASQTGIGFSPDGTRLLVHDRSAIRAIDPRTGAEGRRWAIPPGPKADTWLDVFHAPDGRPCALREVPENEFRVVRVWDLAADRVLLAPPDAGSGRVVVSTTGDHVLVSASTVFFPLPGKAKPEPSKERLFTLPGGLEAATFALAGVPDPGFVDHMRLSAGGRHLLSMQSENTLMMASLSGMSWVVREVPSGAVVLRAPNRTFADHVSEFSPDGRYLILGSDRGHVEVWDLEANETKGPVFRWQPHGGKTVGAVAVSSTGDIATTCEDDDRVCILKWAEVRARLKELGLEW